MPGDINTVYLIDRDLKAHWQAYADPDWQPDLCQCCELRSAYRRGMRRGWCIALAACLTACLIVGLIP